jgi:hypothetical protein
LNIFFLRYWFSVGNHCGAAAALAAECVNSANAAAAVAAAAHGSGLLTEAELGAYLALCPGAAVVSHESQQSACRTAAAKSD